MIQSIVRRITLASIVLTIARFTNIAKSNPKVGIPNLTRTSFGHTQIGRPGGTLSRTRPLGPHRSAVSQLTSGSAVQVVASHYRTGHPSEALSSSDEILSLARQVLSETQYNRAMNLSVMLVSSKSVKRDAFEELTTIVAPPPKRPMSYAQHEIQFLPRWTRDAIRYLGDYVDIVSKHVVYELLKVRTGNASLGATIQLLERRNALPSNILTWLKDYNQFLYRPGKHDFRLPQGRKEHRFTSQEVVLTAFVTLRLVEILKQYSQCNEELNCRHDTLDQQP